MSAPLTPAALGGVQAAVTLGAAVVLPLGLRLLDAAGALRVPRPRSAVWPLAGAAAALALLLPRGPVAVGAVLPFAAATVALATAAVRAWVAPTGGRRRDASLVACTVALGLTTVAALALVGDRAGATVLGFGGDLLLLTVPHMLFTGFGACLAAGLTARAAGAGRSRLARAGAGGVTLGVAAVLVGYFVSDEAELVGTVVLTAGIWCATVAAWRAAAVRDGPRAAAGWAGAAVVGSVVAMLLALWWALGEVTDVAHPDLSWMVATHGAVNALVVVLGSLVALRLRTPLVQDGPAAGAGGGAAVPTGPGGGTPWTTTS